MKTAKLSMMARLKAKKADPKKKPMTVEGSAARPRLDRPMRMKRADGGPTISDDSKRAAGAYRTGAHLAILGPGSDRVREDTARASNAEASRIERGLAEPGKEDRAKGGRVKK